MITSSPCCQLTGVATLCFAVSCSESITLALGLVLLVALVVVVYGSLRRDRPLT